MADNVTKIVSVELNASQAVNGIAQLNQLIQNEKELMKQLTAENKKGTEQYAMAEKAVQEFNRTKRQLQREIQAEVKLEREQTGSLNQLRNQLSDLTKQYDQLSGAERKFGEEGKRLQKQINQITNEIKSAEEGTQRYYRNVGNYQNAIMNAIGLNNGFARSIMGIATAESGVSGAFSAMGSSVKAFGASLMGLMSNPVFLALAGIVGVGMAFKWFYDYNEGLAEATRLTREFTGYAGDDLIAMRNSIQATADVMDKDFKETLQTADALMANFHITGQEAMEIINKGFASGADVNGDFLSKAQQLAPTFHDAGIAADEMVAIISQTRSGIFTDQGLEAIKQGSARIREMSNTTKQALQGIGIDADEMSKKLREGTMTTFDAVKQVSNALKEMPDNAQEVGEVMSAVFGRQGKFASQEMIESLAELSTNLDEVTAKTGEYGELLLENIDTEEELDNVTSALFDMTDKGWEEAKQKAIIYAKKALVAVVKGLLDVTNWFIRLYNKSVIVRTGVNYIIASFKTMWETVKFVFNVIVNAVQRMGDAFTALADIIEGVFSLDAKRVMEGWNRAQKAFKDGWAQMKKDAITAGTNIGTAYGDAMAEAATGQLQELSLPAFTMNGGGGGGGSSSGGGGSSSSGGGSSKKGSRGGRRGASKATSKSSTTQTAKKERDEELERQKKLYQDLLKQAQDLEKKAMDEQAKLSVEGINAKYKAQEDAIRAAYSDLNKLTEEEQNKADEIMKKLIEQNNKEKALAIKAFYSEERKANEELQKQANEQAKKLVEASVEASQEGTDIWLKWRLEQLRLAMEAELEMVGNNSELRNAIIAKYEQQATQIYKENAQAQMEIETQKYNAISTIVGGLAQILNEAGDSQKEFVIMQKTLATAEIMIAQAVAIANAIKDASQGSITVWDMIAKIATGVTAVTTAMIQAFTSLNSAKFATGGYIQGAGTSTSDSIPVRVSNGESIMNANTTAMFSGLLSSLNQLGGGVPIQVQQTAQSVRGEDMLARAFARGVAMLPNPVVSVEDINKGQRQVQVMNERATL